MLQWLHHRLLFVILLATIGPGTFAAEFAVAPNTPEISLVGMAPMIPVTLVQQMLGLTVSENPQTREITIERQGKVFVCRVGSDRATQNGTPVSMAKPAFKYKDILLVPALRLVEGLGGTLKNDGRAFQSTITFPGAPAVVLPISPIDFSEPQYMRDDDAELFLLNRNTGAMQRLTYDTSTMEAPVLSRDGQILAYMRRDSLYLRATANPQEYQMLKGGGPFPAPRYRPYGFTPDGKDVLFVYEMPSRDGLAASQVGLLAVDGKTPPRLLGNGTEPAISPDGKTVAFVSTDVTPPSVVVVNREGGEARTIGEGRHPVLNPNGLVVVYQRQLADQNGAVSTVLLCAPTNGGLAPQRVTDRTDKVIEKDAWYNPQNTLLLFAREGEGIYALDLKTFQERRLTTGATDAQPTLSADGSTLFFIRNNQFCSQPLAGTACKQYTSLDGGVAAFVPTPSPDAFLLLAFPEVPKNRGTVYNGFGPLPMAPKANQ